MLLESKHTTSRVHPSSGPPLAPALDLARRRPDVRRLALALAAAMLAGCFDANQSDAPPEPSQEPSVAATFEVNQSGALLWIYSEESSSARVRVERADGVPVAEVGPVDLPPAHGRTGVAELANLTQDTAYQYVVELENGAAVGPYRFRTAPAPDADAEVHFVWSADIDVSSEFESTIFETMSKSGADFFVNLGDWPYSDNGPAARTIDEYRSKHLPVRAAAKIQTALRALPVYAIYDDHEIRDNWDGRFRMEEPERVANALAVWDEWFPLRAIRAGEERRWRSWRWGRHAEFFMIDTRCCRSTERDPDGPDKTMLGAEQKQWLIDALSASDATFKIVFTSVALIGGSNDDWKGFLHERDQILDELARRGISGLLALTGDGHLFTYRILADRGLHEFMAGPLARHLGPPQPASPTLVYQHQGFNYGEARISSGVDGVPQIEIACRDPQGADCYRQVLRPDDLRLVVP